MKYFIMFCVLASFLTACRKNKKDKEKETASDCLQTTFVNTNVNEQLLSVFFINGKEGFVGGYKGGIYKTTDSANTWTALNSTVTLPVRDICFIDNLKGFAVGGENSCGGTGCIPPGGFIVKTTDGGQNWTKVFTPSDKIEIAAIYFINNTTGFCAGDNVIFKTADGGQTWSEYKVNNLGGKMMDVLFTDAQHGYVVCTFDKIVKTSNGGLTWEVTTSNKEAGYYAVSSAEGSMYVSGQGKIIKSVNGGSSWSQLPNSPADIFAIHFTDKNTGFAFGRGNYSGGDWGYSYGSIYCTDNGGATWNGSADIKEVSLIQSVSFPTNHIGYAISMNKVIKIAAN
ncbi:MAG: hypothetical protein J7621_08555 [Niastella sp.]|nr:hypothetical protein [Niastella sp.]